MQICGHNIVAYSRYRPEPLPVDVDLVFGRDGEGARRAVAELAPLAESVRLHLVDSDGHDELFASAAGPIARALDRFTTQAKPPGCPGRVSLVRLVRHRRDADDRFGSD